MDEIYNYSHGLNSFAKRRGHSRKGRGAIVEHKTGGVLKSRHVLDVVHLQVAHREVSWVERGPGPVGQRLLEEIIQVVLTVRETVSPGAVCAPVTVQVVVGVNSASRAIYFRTATGPSSQAFNAHSPPPPFPPPAPE